MKRITRIEIENSRGYYDRKLFSIGAGENLLLYGENGSGKSSLYKSLLDFIQSFYSSLSFTSNRYKPQGALGEIVLGIGDYDTVTGQVSNELVYRFCDGVNNTNVIGTGYLKSLALTKGFLNYRDLLKVYLYENNNPNLFEFFILTLLRNHVPQAQGLSRSLQEEWEDINNCIFKVLNRNELKHKRGLNNLQKFERILRAVLTDLFVNVNEYLLNYFKSFDITVDYDLAPMVFSYGRQKRDWSIRKDLRLKVSLGTSHISGYINGVNEARLSAIAICLYLSALRANPGSDLRVMFLDDIFIGIDSSNRLPILRILDEKFSDFQIFIATYDRSWYYMAKKFLSKSNSNKWKFAKLFVLPKDNQGVSFSDSVLVEGESCADRAKKYLHGLRDVDLPASANYFRKALEKLLCEKYLPKELFLNEDFTLMPGFKLTSRVAAVYRLFRLVGMDTSYISTIDTYLHPLIHPLSHYEEESPIYRAELLEVEKAYESLSNQLVNFNHHCQLLSGKNTKLEIHYSTTDGSYKAVYQLLLDDNLWIYKTNAGTYALSDCACMIVYMKGEKNGVDETPFKPKKRDYRFTYASLDEALQKIYDHEIYNRKNIVEPHNDYDIVFNCVSKSQVEPFVNRRDQILQRM